jgi:AraC family transcriptional regulator, positive regulator of tynA and feaB
MKALTIEWEIRLAKSPPGDKMRKLLRRSTDDVAPDLRVRHWREVVHDSVLEMDVLPATRVDFISHIELCPLSNIVPHHVKGSAQKITRNEVEIARGNKNAFYLISQTDHAWSCSHANEDHLIKPGESVLIDSRIPFSFTFAESLDDLSIELPVEWIDRWIPDTARVIGRPLTATDGWGLALRGVKEALAPKNLVSLALPDELIEDQLGALLALATGSQIDPPQFDREVLECCISVIRSRMSKPGLVASEVAHLCAISLRTLHRTFAAAGQTFAGVLMQARIDQAAGMLSDRRFGHLTIGEIGRRCGFLDPSHFARQFRRLRHACPRHFRS